MQASKEGDAPIGLMLRQETLGDSLILPSCSNGTPQPPAGHLNLQRHASMKCVDTSSACMGGQRQLAGHVITSDPHIPPAKRSSRRRVGRWRGWGQVGVGAGQQCFDFGVELGVARVLFPQLLGLAPDPIGISPDLLGFALDPLGIAPDLFGFFPQRGDLPLAFDRFDLEIDDGSPVEHRQPASPTRQRGEEFLPADRWGWRRGWGG
jgi:hypothetical protein